MAPDITRKPAFANWRNLLSIQNAAIALVAMRGKELWLVEENHATVKLDVKVASRGMKTYSESRIELDNLQILKKYWKSQVSFCHQGSHWAEKPGCCLKYCRSWKNTLGDLAVAVNTGGHSIRVLNERNASDGGNLFPLWLVILKSVWYSVGNTL